MLRGMRLALLCLLTVAAPAQANDGGYAGGAAQASASLTVPSSWGGAEGGFQGEVVDPGAYPSLRQRRERQDAVALPWLKPGRSGVAVALTERLRLGLGYRYLEGEDLWPEFADTGAANYESHHLLIRASWRF